MESLNPGKPCVREYGCVHDLTRVLHEARLSVDDVYKASLQPPSLHRRSDACKIETQPGVYRILGDDPNDRVARCNFESNLQFFIQRRQRERPGCCCCGCFSQTSVNNTAVFQQIAERICGNSPRVNLTSDDVRQALSTLRCDAEKNQQQDAATRLMELMNQARSAPTGKTCN